MLQFLISLFFHPKVGRYIFYVSLCVSSFAVGCHGVRIIFNKNKWVWLTAITAVAWIVRLFCLFQGYDEFAWYSNIYTYYTQALMSIWFVYSFFLIEKYGWLKPFLAIEWLDSISYEVFLCHYAFIDGPFKIIGRIGNLFIESIIVIIISLIVGSVLSFIFRKFYLKCNI